MLDWLIWINGEFELFRELSNLRGGAIEIEGEGSTGFSAEDDIFGNCHALDQHKMLVDHPDTERNRIMRRFDIANLAIDKHLSAVSIVETIRDAHRRRVARAVLDNDNVKSPMTAHELDILCIQY